MPYPVDLQKMSLTKYQTTQEQVTDAAIIYLEQHQQLQQLPLKIIWRKPENQEQ